ncbi:MAG: vWA domain-containing protein, partial [Acidimicrobiia bacterium]
LYHGDLSAALRRLLREGYTDASGERMPGLRELLERIEQRRRGELRHHDLSGVADGIRRRLDEVVDLERLRIGGDLPASPEDSSQDDAAGLRQRADELDQLPGDLAGRIQALSAYEFLDEEARRRFEALVEELRRQVSGARFGRLAAGLAQPDPAQLARSKDALADLNCLVEQRARGEEIDFAGFMARHGDLFPGNPQDLDELLSQLAARAAAFSSFLSCLSPDQRDEIEGLARALLDDLDLAFELDRLAHHLREEFPDLGWERRLRAGGEDPFDLASLDELLDNLSDLDGLEHLLSGATNPAALAEADLEAVRRLLGDDAARSLAELSRMARLLEDAGLARLQGGALELTPRGIRRIGEHALSDLFTSIERNRLGSHGVERPGVGHEASFGHRPYEFGDPMRLDVPRTLRNALARRGPGAPIALSPEDFEVEQPEQVSRCATVLLLDLSLSMPLRDRFLPAKKVALALTTLVSSRFPTDYLGLVGFSDFAREIRPDELPGLSWDFVYGTNLEHALRLARRLLAGQGGTRQILLVTDGEPTAHIEAGGKVFFSYPPEPRTIQLTLAEVTRVTREGIRINTFMLDPTPHLRRFVERLTRLNRGRAFFTDPGSLGDYLLVDFVEHRRAHRRGR